MTPESTERVERRIVPLRDAIVTPDGAPLASEVLSQEEYQALKGGFSKRRDLLVCKVLRGTGLRIAEVLRLTPEIVGQDGPSAYVLAKRGKKKKGQRTWTRVTLPPELGIELRDWIRGQGVQPGQRVFAVTARQVRNAFAKAGLASIGRSVHPHELRALYIKYLVDNRVPVEAAAKLVGHNDVRTTMEHYYDLTRDQREAIQRRIPV